MSALFNLSSLSIVCLFFIATCTYIKAYFPSLITNKNKGMSSVFYKATVVGERCSPFISLCFLYFGLKTMKEALVG